MRWYTTDKCISYLRNITELKCLKLKKPIKNGGKFCQILPTRSPASTEPSALSAMTTFQNRPAHTHASAVGRCCFRKLINLTAGPAGHLLHGRQRAQTWAKALIKVGFQPEQKCIAKPVLRIWGMCFPMALLRLVCATV